MVITDRELFILLNLFFLLGAFSSLALNKYPSLSNYTSSAFSLMGSLCGIFLSIHILASGEELTFKAPTFIPWIDFCFSIDGLAAFFILVISLLALATAIYSMGYNRGFYDRNVGLLGSGVNLFLLSMIGVVSVDNALVFLIFWEVMSLVSYFLVVYEYEKGESVKAGLIYIIMAHGGTAFITAAFLFLYRFSGSFSFDAFRATSATLPNYLKDILFIFSLLGFGTKAGIVPLHIWLPRAHPAAPSNVSALMSGVMIKVAIYGFIRMVLDVLGGGSLWWGVLVLTVAAVSAFLGVLYALVEHDLKRLLAYHSVENIGIILLGVGAAMIFSSFGAKEAAGIALVAGLFHVLNHALFKGLLFFGAGAVLYSTHNRNIEELGGLIKKMPLTGFFFLIGAVSISGLPPFNGFVSEWLMFQGLLLGFSLPDALIRVLLPIAGVVLGFSSALAASCFVKAFGITFLGLPRSGHAQEAVEVPFPMCLSMGILAGLCLALGVLPQYLLSLISNISSSLLHAEVSLWPKEASWVAVIPIKLTLASFSPHLVFIFLAVFLTSLCLVLCALYRIGPVRIEETWGCGIPLLTSRMEYTATAFSKPFMMIFRSIYRTTEGVEVITTHVPLQPHFTRIKRYREAIGHVFEGYLYEPMVKGVMEVSRRMGAIQAGSLHLYLLYIFITLIILLFWVR